MKNLEKYKLAIKDMEEDETLSLTHLANKYGFTRSCFSTYLKNNGYTVKKRGKSTEIEKKQKSAIKLYEEGMSIKAISEKLGISRKSLGLYFKEQNVKLRTETNQVLENYIVDDNFFKEIDTEKKAYWLGFIYADGSVRNDKGSHQLNIELNEVDFNHLKKFRRDIKSNKPIKKRKNRPMCSISINSKEIVSDLFNIGCVKNKTEYGFLDKNILKDDLTKKAFLRGYLDGDGFIDKGSKWRIVYTVKSEKLLNLLLELLNEYGIHTKVYDLKSYYRINIERKNDFLKLLDILYKDAKVYLDRKYETYLLRTQPFQEETLEMISAELNGEVLPNMYETKDNVLG